jgi:CubicO group peptidase (beta-lactamase class C family)
MLLERRIFYPILGRDHQIKHGTNAIKIYYQLLLCVFLLSLSRLAVSSGPPPLQAEMERALQEQALTGVVWALVTPNGDSTGAAGLANAATGEPMTTLNRVHMGSVSKTVLATGVLRLITSGQISLDTPVSDLLADVHFNNPWAASDPVRVRHLLAHTAGLDNLRFWQAFSQQPTADTPLIAAFSRDPALLRLRTKPGSTYSYSNMGYGVLGLVIEAVTGERYEDYLDTGLLQPLSMLDSSFEFISQSGPNGDERLAMGHFENGRTQGAVPIYLRPAGQFTSTAADMAAFARFLMGDGMIDGEIFIAPGLLKALDRPQGTEAALAGLRMGHGLALARRDRHGVVGMCHPGEVAGFRAMMCLFPGQEKAFFAAINTDSETADYDRFNALLIDALDVAGGQQQAPKAAPPEQIADWQGFYIPSPNNMEQFAWVDRVFNFMRVDWDGSRLRLKPLQSSERQLIPSGEMLFRATDRTVTSHVLFESAGGARIISDGLHQYERVTLTSLLALWVSVIAGLIGMTWILLTGLGRAFILRLKVSSVLFVPFIAICALLLPLPFFQMQSFLQLGDLTVASALLALVTGTLPLAMIFGIASYLRRKPEGVLSLLDAIACFAVLQWTIVLMAGNLLPFQLWV